MQRALHLAKFVREETEVSAANAAERGREVKQSSAPGLAALAGLLRSVCIAGWRPAALYRIRRRRLASSKQTPGSSPNM